MTVGGSLNKPSIATTSEKVSNLSDCSRFSSIYLGQNQKLPSPLPHTAPSAAAPTAGGTTTTTKPTFTQHASSQLPQSLLGVGQSAATTLRTNVISSGCSINSINCQMTNTTTNSNKFPQTTKPDPRITGPSTFRQLLPIALCVLSFATVLSILLVYMDTTEIQHQQFRLNMSRDYELLGVQQDDPTLVAFIREIHMKKYPMNFLKNAPVEHLNFTERHELTPAMAQFIASLVNSKTNGVFIQSMTGSTSQAMTGPWMAETLNWSGLLVEPEPRRYFSLRKQNVHRPKVQVVHACLSPNGYPKEITIHNDEDADVRINSLLDEEISWFNSRVKCFPLYTIMLAVNMTTIDLLSLGCPGHELQILETLPFEKVNIEIITIHLTENEENPTEFIQNLSKFLYGKSYRFVRKLEKNYIYQNFGSSRTTSSSSSSLSTLMKKTPLGNA